MNASWALRCVAAVALRPSLWFTAIVQLFRLARPGWWRSWPFLPRPDREYLRFRLETQYGGSGDQGADPADLITYLEWCRDF